MNHYSPLNITLLAKYHCLKLATGRLPSQHLSVVRFRVRTHHCQKVCPRGHNFTIHPQCLYPFPYIKRVSLASSLPLSDMFLFLPEVGKINLVTLSKVSWSHNGKETCLYA